ncbi:hypothetical protein [Nocardia nova]|uniref:hypothetical protein n=1 Tax=Nocardia nova TaxID=37330 RepID=UPI002738C932|nr:hypothetical protein [Nocardia nova]
MKIKSLLAVAAVGLAGILAAPVASAQGFLLPGTASAQTCYFPWLCPPPPPPTVTWTQFASDDFNRVGPDLGPNWIIRGAGVPYIQNQESSGAGTPSVPTSYGYWATPASTHVQSASATVRWEGRDPAHSLAALSVRADPSRMGTDPVNWTTQTGASGVMFWFTSGLMGLDYEHPNTGTASNPSYFTPLNGTASYVSTSKFPEGARIELRVTEGANGVDTYTAYVNGTQVLQGTLSTSIVPRTQHYVGFETQDDGTASSANGQPAANLDDFVASQGS